MATSSTLLLGAVAAMALLSSRALSGDAAYVFGGLLTGGSAGFDTEDLFVARPFVHRSYLGGILTLVQASGLDPASAIGMFTIRACGWLTAGLAAWILWLGLRGFARRSVAGWTALAVGLALIASPNWYALQPDWLAVVLSVTGVGVGLRAKSAPGSALAGVLFTLAIGAKIAAIPWVLLALLVIAVLAPRRAVVAGTSTVVLAATMFVAQEQFLPWENQWLRDQVDLVHASPLSTGITPYNIFRGVRDSIDVAFVNPVIWAAVPAVALLVARRPTVRSRVITAALAIVGLALSVASGYGQGEHFAYHWVGMPVVAAGAVGWAFAQERRGRIPLVLSMLASALLSLALTRQSADWRASSQVLAVAAFGVLVLGAAAVALLSHRSQWPSRSPQSPLPEASTWRWAPALAALALSCLLIVPLLPTSSGSFAMYNSGGPVGASLSRHQAEREGVARIRGTLPVDTPVLYLTYGATNFVVANPATCRYPSPQWLQRATTRPEVEGMASYRDDLACLTPDVPAFVVWDTQWFPHDRMPAQVRTYLDGSFDCDASHRVGITNRNVWICPRRGDG